MKCPPQHPVPSCCSIREFSPFWCPLSHLVLPALLQGKQHKDLCSHWIREVNGPLWWLSADWSWNANSVSGFLCSFSAPKPLIHSFTQQRSPECFPRVGLWAGLLHQSKLGLTRVWARVVATQKGKGSSFCVSPFHASSFLFPAYSSSYFLLSGASLPTQPHSDEVNNQGVSFKYQLAQGREPTCQKKKNLTKGKFQLS